MALERPQCATALELSHLERLVSGGGNGVSAVWSHRRGVDLTSVALEGSQCAASLQLPLRARSSGSPTEVLAA